jgi:hypothetical protein
MEKFSKSTFSERKIMSTKTSIKRIAAVAAVALTLGGFSAVSASAAGTALTKGNAIIFAWTGDGIAGGDNGTSAYDATNKLGLATGAGVAGPVNTVTTKIQYDAGDGTAATAYTDGAGVKRAVVTVSGSGATIASGGTPNTAGTQTLVAANNSLTDLVINTPAAGTVTVSVYKETAQASGIFSATAAETVTWTIAATASSGTFSVANSTAYDTTTTSAAATASLTAGNGLADANAAAVARYDLTLLDTLSAPMVASTKYSVSLSGPGSLAVGAYGTANLAGAAGARVIASTYATPTFFLFGDGTTGVSTLTVSVGSTVLATKTFTFYSTKVAAITTTLSRGYVAAAAKTGFTASTYHITAQAKDASGNIIPSASGLSVKSSDTTVATVGSFTYVSDSTSTAYQSSTLPITGVAAGTATITVSDASTGLITSTQVITVTSAVAATAVLALDAASYSAGDKVTWTVTAKNSVGSPIADGTYGAILASSATNVSVVGTLPTTDLTFKAGVATGTFYAPSASFTFTVTLGTAATTAAAIQGTALTASATVTNAAADAAQAAVDAANEATDAANAATDAANNAMDSADAAQQAALDAGDKADAALAAVTDLASKVADIATQISALSSLVSKIAASVAKISAKVKA